MRKILSVELKEPERERERERERRTEKEREQGRPRTTREKGTTIGLLLIYILFISREAQQKWSGILTFH